MRTKHILTLAEVDEILAAARNEAVKHNWAVTIAVVEDGGHLPGLSRLDGASPVSASRRYFPNQICLAGIPAMRASPLHIID
ncbi:hypothetical protein GNZ12_42295 [Paraburkholderia sp. 1N]|uniref:Glc operon protein GlcG n=1 Tax=Paraburkholderia solitsugae TaxID=2675748 RepID=A0ABX2C6V8_9BURK|nr:hypothetical protein [Paraburkholderia solitsugae]